MVKERFIIILLIAVISLPFLSGDCVLGKEDSATAESEFTSCVLKDKPIADYQVKLLTVAFETATAIPLYPHRQDRARAQEKVVETCLKLDQPARAMDYTDKIKNWRRGVCYADLAFYCVKNGCDEKQVQPYLDIAVKESTAAAGWRRDNIKMKVARTHSILGNKEKADKFSQDLTESQRGKAGGATADLCDKDFDQHVKSLEEMIETGNYDMTSNALTSFTELYMRFYKNARRRSVLEKKIMKYSGRLPIIIRIKLHMKLARNAIAHQDRKNALGIINIARNIFDDAKWTLRNKIPLMARLAEIRFLAGDKGKARSDLDAALAIFDENVGDIINIYRADALRPIAESYQTMKDTSAALAVYEKAVEHGVDNPNSKPRARDLSATCCSMALHDVEPDAELWERIQQISDGLGEPW